MSDYSKCCQRRGILRDRKPVKGGRVPAVDRMMALELFTQQIHIEHLLGARHCSAGEAAESMTDKAPCFHGPDLFEGKSEQQTEISV